MSVSRNAMYNVLGAAVPSVLTLVTVPLYLAVIGVERFGVLTLCWAIIGYAGVLDIGLGLAAARKIAAARDGGPEAGELFWTTMWISLLIGLAGAVVMYAGANAYFGTLAEAGSPLGEELRSAAAMLAAVVPIVMVGGVLVGALTGRERFLLLNLTGAVSNSLTAGLPLLAAYFWRSDLETLLGALLVARLLPIPFLYWSCKRSVPLGGPMRPVWHRARELLSFSSWLTLTLTANAVIQTLDRLLIGSRIGPAAVPIYTIPYGLVSRIVLIPHSLSTALFPRFAYVGEEEKARLTSSSIQGVTVIITPAIIAVIACSDPFFRLWIGAELASFAAPVAYVLAGGFWVYSIGHVAYSKLQAIGRPDLVAKVLLCELVPYSILLVVGLWAFGVIGAAFAFTARAFFDCLIFLWFAAVPARTVRWLALPSAMTGAAVLLAAFVPWPLSHFLLAGLFAAAVTWSLLNIPDSLKPHLTRFTGFLHRIRRA